MGYLSYLYGLLFVIVLSIEYGNSIECYECNSSSDKRCIGDENNRLEDDLLRQCGDKTPEGKPYILCRKIKQVIDFEVNGLQPESRVIRTCGWDDSSYKNRCYQRSGFGGRQEVCACESDKCNDSTTLHASTSLVLAALLIFLKFRM